jgi:hypothetical protein
MDERDVTCQDAPFGTGGAHSRGQDEETPCAYCGRVAPKEDDDATDA